MRNLLKTSVAILVAAATMSSCEKPVTEKGDILSLSESGKTVASSEMRTSVTVVSKVAWTLSVATDGDWEITPSVTEGESGSTTVRFTFPRNESEQTRTGTVTFTASGRAEPYTFTITQNSVNVPTGVNGWILEQLEEWYYWNDAVKALTNPPDGSLAYNEFLAATISSLRWSDVQDRSNGENPATIDGQYEVDSYNNLVLPASRRSIYSYIDRYPAGTRSGRSAASSAGVTFGFNIKPFQVGGSASNPQLWLLVSVVRPGSPAANAGLKRGVWVAKYNGADIYWDQYIDFFYKLNYQEGGNTLAFADEKGTSYNLTATSMKLSPIFVDDVLTTSGGKKVAYLLYDGFDMGDAQGNGYEFETELSTAFARFKSEGATELVLDLRYNPGGFVTTCQKMVNLIADVSTSDVFAKLRYNDDITEANPDTDYPIVLKFRGESNSMKLHKVYILATRSSASASEMVINSIRGVLGEDAVVHIGERTNGKNVGSDLLQTTIDEYRYEMRPITFKILNASDFTDYANGFTPDYYIEEFWDLTDEGGSGIIRDLGDPEERLLKAALNLIDGRSVRPDAQASASASPTRAAGGKRIFTPVTPLTDHRRGGAIVIPEQAR